MIAENIRLIGKISKLHGVQGKAILIFDEEAAKELNKAEWVFLMIEGIPVPFMLSFIEIISYSSAIIQLNEINTAEKMQPYIGCNVGIVFNKKRQTSTVKSIIGYSVINDNYGKLGNIENIDDYNGNIVARIYNEKGEILFPLNNETIIEVNHKKQILKVNIPDGLLSLYLK